MATTATTTGVNPMATTATTAGVNVSAPSTGRTTAATNSFTLSESTAATTAAASTRTTPLESQVTAEREQVIADVKDTQAGQFNAVDNLSHTLENTQAATESLFARDLPAEVGTERQADPVGAGIGVGGVGSSVGSSSSSSSSSNTIVVPATGQQGVAALGNATLLHTVTVSDSGSTVTTLH